MLQFIIFALIASSTSNALVDYDVNPEDLEDSKLDNISANEVKSGVNYFYPGKAKSILIYPGTKWCGKGNIAQDYDDLGPSRRADMCCRDHDNCPVVIDAGQTDFNLTNPSFYARLSCKCDEAFRKCLRKVNNKDSKILGAMYFNSIGTMCYRKDFPIISCKKKSGWFIEKCVEYELDTERDMCYQWFDVPYF